MICQSKIISFQANALVVLKDALICCLFVYSSSLPCFCKRKLFFFLVFFSFYVFFPSLIRKNATRERERGKMLIVLFAAPVVIFFPDNVNALN